MFNFKGNFAFYFLIANSCYEFFINSLYFSLSDWKPHILLFEYFAVFLNDLLIDKEIGTSSCSHSFGHKRLSKFSRNLNFYFQKLKTYKTFKLEIHSHNPQAISSHYLH